MNGGQEEADECGDDADHDEQFHKRETAATGAARGGEMTHKNPLRAIGSGEGWKKTERYCRFGDRTAPESIAVWSG